MKISHLICCAALLATSFSTTANSTHIYGTFDSYDENAQTISIVTYKGGDLVTFKYSQKADIENHTGKSIKLSSLRKGTDVTLKLNAE